MKIQREISLSQHARRNEVAGFEVGDNGCYILGIRQMGMDIHKGPMSDQAYRDWMNFCYDHGYLRKDCTVVNAAQCLFHALEFMDEYPRGVWYTKKDFVNNDDASIRIGNTSGIPVHVLSILEELRENAIYTHFVYMAVGADTLFFDLKRLSTYVSIRFFEVYL